MVSKKLSFTKLSFWRTCFQLGRNTYDICDKSWNAQYGKTQFFRHPVPKTHNKWLNCYWLFVQFGQCAHFTQDFTVSWDYVQSIFFSTTILTTIGEAKILHNLDLNEEILDKVTEILLLWHLVAASSVFSLPSLASPSLSPSWQVNDYFVTKLDDLSPLY